MITNKYILEYRQTEKSPFSDPIVRSDTQYFDLEKTARDFIVELKNNRLWDLDWYCLSCQEIWRK